jgi:hypothetical protein
MATHAATAGTGAVIAGAAAVEACHDWLTHRKVNSSLPLFHQMHEPPESRARIISTSASSHCTGLADAVDTATCIVASLHLSSDSSNFFHGPYFLLITRRDAQQELAVGLLA